ncbi:MAG TPA: signal peptidase II [Acidimicrobiales bacterium]|nr:signal peptidase II [Acidimicrobiales bacterium]
MRATGRGAVLAGVAAAVVIADQATKSWAQQALIPEVPRHVLGPTNLVLTYNSGAAFSLGAGASPVIEALAVTLAAVVLWLSGRLARGGGHVAGLVGFGLVGGGALSNLGDRFIRHHHGAVVDFVQLVSWWPIFNLADAAITIGAVTIAAVLLFGPDVQQGGVNPAAAGTDKAR